MYPYNLVLSLFIIVGTFALLMVLTLIALLVKHKSVGKSAALSSLRNFLFCFFCIVVLYYITSYIGIHQGVFRRSMPGRVAEFLLFLLLDYFWFVFIRTHLAAQGAKRPVFDKIANWLLAGFFVVSAIDSACLMESDYSVSEPALQFFAAGVEALCCITISIFSMLYMMYAVKSQIDRQTKVFIIVISFLLLASRLLSGIVTVRLIVRRMTYAVESFYYDPTSLIMILTAVSALLYLFWHDFSPIYFTEQKEEISDEEVLNLLAQEYGLSKREREVAGLIFQGDSYEAIAEQLYISKLTVKKHVHNLYEKLDVSKRMELINLVRMRKTEEKQK